MDCSARAGTRRGKGRPVVEHQLRQELSQPLPASIGVQTVAPSRSGRDSQMQLTIIRHFII